MVHHKKRKKEQRDMTFYNKPDVHLNGHTYVVL